MTRLRLISLFAVAALLVGGWILVSKSQVKYRVDLTSLVKMWSDVVRDTDEIGLTLTRVSDRREMEFGTELAKQLAPFIFSDPKLEKYVSEVGQRLVEQVRRKAISYKFHVINDAGINAFALPGGHIYVTKGMLEFATSEAELAAIIAHEINHVDLRHCIERFQYELLTRRILPSDLAAISRLPYFLFRAPYNEQQEREADVDAVIMMAKAGYHPMYELSIDDRMAEIQKEGRTPTRPPHIVEELSTSILQALKEYFKTHPSWPDRVHTIAAVLQRNESKWKDQKFYVGRLNHIQRTSWATQPIDNELRPYIEPPAYRVYLSDKKYSSFKALAVHLASGLSGFAWDEATPVAAIARAMSECEKKIKPCQLYAVGDAVVIDMTPHQVDAVVSRYSISGQIARAFKTYLLAADFKALVVDPSTGRSAMGAGLTTPANAIEEAQARCAEGGQVCELYAVGDVVVHGLPKEQADAAIKQYRQRVIADRIAELEQVYLYNWRSSDFKALVVDYQSAQIGVSQGRKSLKKAIEEATSACAESGHICELYAVGDVVVRGLPREQAEAAIEQYRQRVVADRIAKLEQAYFGNRTYSDFKALAVDHQSGYSAVSHSQATLEKAIKEATGSCAQGSDPCALYAVGDVMVHGLPKEQVDAVIEQYRLQVSTDRIAKLEQAYLGNRAYADFMALAVDYQSGQSAVSQGQATPLKAIEQAIEACATQSPTCELHAIGNTIVRGKSKEERDIIVDAYARKAIEKIAKGALDDYLAKRDFKSFVVDVPGKYWAFQSNHLHPAAAVTAALKMCRQKGKTCQVAALGDTIIFDKPKEELDTLIGQYYSRAVWPTNPLREYLSESRFIHFKAFVADPHKMKWQREWGDRSPSQAIEQAMARCRSQDLDCEIYAIGNHVVYGQSDEEQKAAIASYVCEVLEKNLEFLRQPSHRDFKAVAGNSDSMQYRFVEGHPSASDAVAEAMRDCTENYAPCQLFAVGNVVVYGLPQERIDQIIEQYQRDVDTASKISN